MNISPIVTQDLPERIKARAVAAYYTRNRQGGWPLYHSDRFTDLEEGQNGHPYVAIRNTSETLAVYRYRNNGVLRRLRRWPKDLNYPNENVR